MPPTVSLRESREDPGDDFPFMVQTQTSKQVPVTTSLLACSFPHLDTERLILLAFDIAHSTAS
jgi:hypothetical protein